MAVKITKKAPSVFSAACRRCGAGFYLSTADSVICHSCEEMEDLIKIARERRALPQGYRR